MRPKLNNILIVDDNKNDLQLAQHYLDKRFDGLMYMIAESKRDFYEKLSWLKPDLIISDFDLPDGTGLDLLIDIRKKGDIPFIFMSGALDDSDQSLSMSILNGASGYVLKDRIKSLPDIVDHVMKKEYEKRQARQEETEKLTRLKLKVSKALNLAQSGADTSMIIEAIESASEILKQL